MNIATSRETRPPELDTFAAAFAVAGEKNRRWFPWRDHLS